MSGHWPFRMALAALLGVVAAASALTQEQETDLNPIKWSLKAKLPAKPLKVGEKFSVELSARIDRGWHLYSTEPVENGPKPTRITLPKGQAFEQTGEIESPAPRAARDPNFGVEVEFYEGSVTFTIPVRVLPGAAPGGHKLMAQVRYQSCSQELCLPPKLVKLEAPIEIAAANPAR
ncbi:MAG: protein-disulfide reductase DsbD N-terminal domain-containing protein [Blastocatellia bacterium]